MEVAGKEKSRQGVFVKADEESESKVAKATMRVGPGL
jgi:hypothetical protein